MKECFFEERKVYYRTNDIQPNRPTLVFVHGLSGSSSAWLPYERALESRYNLISLDLRGHGKSQKFLFYSAYTPNLIASDIVALLKHLNIAQSIIIGHSFGTLLTVAAVQQDPSRFSKIFLISPTFGASAAWWLPLARMFTAFFRLLSLLLPFNSRPRGHVDYEKLIPTWDWSPRRIVQDIRNTSARVYFFCVQHIYKLDMGALWKSIKIPTLIIHGKNDTVIPVAQAVRLHELLPNSELVLVDNADHMLPLNYPKKVLPVLEAFVEKHSDARISV